MDYVEYYGILFYIFKLYKGDRLMVALAFFLILVVLFFVALFFIILNVIFIIIWKLKKRKGKNPKKRYIVIPIIFLIISLLVELIPVGWVGLMRAGNKRNSKDVVMAESGEVVYWGELANGDTAVDNFKMYNMTYVEVPYSGSSNTLKLGKPVANIKSKANEEGLNRIVGALFASNFTSTVYPVINDKDLEIYTIGRNTNTIYCPENEKNMVLAYLKEISH